MDALFKVVFGLPIVLFLVVLGCFVSVGAWKGWIVESRMIETSFKATGSQWGQGATDFGPFLLGQLEVRYGDSVEMSFPSWGYSFTSGINVTIYAADAENNTVRSWSFILGFSGWQPMINEPLVFLFQKPGTYSFYSTVHLPEDMGPQFSATCRIVTTDPPPYLLALVAGFVLILVGVAGSIYVLRIIFITKSEGQA
jgi:hypothetical protein